MTARPGVFATLVAGEAAVQGEGMNEAARSRSYQPEIVEGLKDVGEAAAYLNASLEDEDPRVFLLALRDVAEARGGVGRLSSSAGLNRESLYRTLSSKGNPRLRSLDVLLHAMGLRLAVEVESQSRAGTADG